MSAIRTQAEQQPIICIVGPTASGKSELAQRVAETINGEIVSADSMQIYRGMDIGTGKVIQSERRVVHHCIDVVDPGEPYSAALFQQSARDAFDAIWDCGKQPILCGGTGFYVRAAIDDYDFPAGEQLGNAVRDEMNAFVQAYGARALWDRLNEVDPLSAEIIPENDTKRVVRAFELLDAGCTYAEQREKLATIPQRYPAIFVGLSVERDTLVERIDARVNKMIDDGLVNEVSSLLGKGFRAGLCAPQAIGYKEIVAYLDGNDTLENAVESIKLATRRYAKRQRTWFRKDMRINWIDANDLDYDRMLKAALSIIELQ